MKRFHEFFPRQARIIGTVLLILTFGSLPRTEAQQQSETAESLGLGGASRFDTGYSPIVLDRTSIVPGTPFNVKPTMDNLVSSSKTSMGGILNRFDTTRFGQMFGSGATAAVAAAPITRKTPPVAVAATTGAVAPEVYPPGLEMDGQQPDARGVDESARRKTARKISCDIDEVLSRYPLTDPEEGVTFDLEGTKVTLRGRVNSSYVADVLVLAVEMEPEVEKVVNEIVSLNSGEEE
ncbi:MAG: hypothetical protein IK105_00245 [Thermoguttaceae bacterium]|nr:hypothetical protein [Thermoguttaceae bacterium]MBR6480803.1 hypothetical protein [Thermoguttaceae bacterium]